MKQEKEKKELKWKWEGKYILLSELHPKQLKIAKKLCHNINGKVNGIHTNLWIDKINSELENKGEYVKGWNYRKEKKYKDVLIGLNNFCSKIDEISFNVQLPKAVQSKCIEISNKGSKRELIDYVIHQTMNVKFKN